MPLLAALSREATLVGALRSRVRPAGDVAEARSWYGLVRLVRERPVTCVALDGAALTPPRAPHLCVAELRRRFPSVAIVFVHGRHDSPWTLFRLGRVGLDGLALASASEGAEALWDAIGRAATDSTDALVARAIGVGLPSWETSVIRLALNGVQLGWDTESLANATGLTRPHLSVRLKSAGLPSAGHLLIWAKLLHAGRWLSDGGRSAESVSRQLEYSSGAAFRRALHNYVGGTPTEVKQTGGFWRVLAAFLDVCGLGASLGSGRSVA